MPLSIRNGIFRPAPDTQALATGAEERLRITPSGEIGIGTLTPAERLEVNGGIRVGLSTNNNAGTIRWTGTQMEYNDGTAWLPFGGGSSLWTQNGTEIYYDAGNVGVGLNDPITTFHVGGDVRIGKVAPVGGSGTASEGPRLYFSGGDSNSSWNSDNSDPLWIARYNEAPDTSRLRVNIGDNPDSDDGLEIGFRNGASNGPWVSNFFFGSDGNFGIQTTLPSERLDVNGRARVRTLPPNPNLNNVVVADSAGVLHVRDARTLGGAGGSIWTQAAGTDNIFYTAGNVGVGTNNPAGRLHVKGGNLLFSGSGRMGIGTATPGVNFKLDIEGRSRMRSTHFYGRNTAQIRLNDNPAAGTVKIKIEQADMKTSYIYAEMNISNGEVDIDPGLFDGQILVLVCGPNTGASSVPLSTTNTNGFTVEIARLREVTVNWLFWCAPESVWCIQR